MTSVPPFDFGRAVTFSFEDPRDRMKIVVACAIYFASLLTASCLVGILGFALLWGYQRRVALATMSGADVPLPEWDRWGDDLMHGLRIFGIRLVYALPGIAIIAGAYLFFIAALIAAEPAEPPPAVILAFFGAFALGIPLMLLGHLFGYLGTIRYIDTGEISSAFALGEVFRFVRENLGPLLFTLLLGIAMSFLANIVGLLLLIIGAYFTPGWWYIPTGHAYGQVLRAHRVRHAAAASATFE